MDILWARNLLRPQDFGGSRYHWEVTRRLAARGHRLRVVVGRMGGPLPGATGAEVIEYPISTRTPLHTFMTHALFSQRAIRREMSRALPETIVLSSYDVAFGHYAVRSWRVRVPTVFIYHSSFLSDAVRRVRHRRLPARLAAAPLDRFVVAVERLVVARADRLIAVSPFSKHEIERRLGHADDRIVIVPTGVDTQFFAPGNRLEARRQLGLPQDAAVLLTVGRLVPVKRYDRAIDATALLRRTDPSVVLLIAGTGPLERELRERAAALGDAVRFLGFVDGEALRRAYHAADVMLTTSDFENWSVAILEALATGTPVIGTPTGSTPDLLRYVDASLVLPDLSVNSLARRTHEILADPVSRERLAARAREEVIRRFGWDETTTALEREIAIAARPQS